MALSKNLLNQLQEYVNLNLATIKINEEVCFLNLCENSSIVHNDMLDFINTSKTPSFNKILFEYIDKLETIDSQVYKKAGIDRRLFSKIRSTPDYHPSKNTAIALAFALNLEQEDVDKLLTSAGYILSNSETFDLVITFCLQRKIYDINDVNLALDYFSLKPLIGVNK